MAITITVDGVDRTANVYRAGSQGNVRFSMSGGSWYAEFTLYDQDGTSSAYRPDLGDDVLIEENGTDVFHGRVDKVSEGAAPGSESGLVGTHSRVRCKAFSSVVDQVVVNEDYAGVLNLQVANSSVANPTSITTNQPHGLATGDRVRIEDHQGSTPAIDGDYAVTVTSHSTFTIPVNVTVSGGGGTVRKIYLLKTIVSDLRTNYLDDYGITLDAGMANGPDIEAPTIKDASLRQVFDRFSTETGYIWRITPTDELQFFSPGTESANYDITAANRLSRGPISWDQSLDDYFNDVYLRYGPDAVEAVTEVFTGDGSNNLFDLGYQPVTVNRWIISQGYVLEPGNIRYALSPLSVIAASSVANPTTITTDQPHGYIDGDTVIIQGHSGSTPDINGTHTVTVTGVYTFTIPVNVTVAGTGGSTYNAASVWLYYEPDNQLVRVGALASETVAEFIYSVQFPQTVHVSDSGEIASRGTYTMLFERPDIKLVAQAREYADGLLRNGIEIPRTVTVPTRNGFPGMPGDQLTLTFADRLISGTYTIRDVSAADVTLSGTFEYLLTCQSGDELKRDYADRFKNALISGGTRGGTITGGALIAPGGITNGPVQGTRVVIVNEDDAVLEFRPQRLSGQQEGTSTVEMLVSTALVDLSDITRDSGGEASAALLQISRTTGETTFATGLTHQNVNNAARFTPLSFNVANAGIQAIGDNSPSGTSGFLFVEDVTNAVYAIFYLRGGNAQVSTIAASAGWSTTASTGSSRNVYWDAGDSRYELENNSGGTVSFRIFHIGLLN